MNQLALTTASPNLPALIAAAADRASLRFLEFFAANIRNPHTRCVYSRAIAEFMALVRRQPGALDHRRAAVSYLDLDRAADALACDAAL